MLNFTCYNRTRIVFGRCTIEKLAGLLPAGAKPLLLFGGGSVKTNGVYDQVTAALKNTMYSEFWGVEPNPYYETCLRAVAQIKEQKLNFVLPVGGGSVFDAAKFIAAAACWTQGDPWEICLKKPKLQKMLPIGGVLTLPATASEMNGGAVISRKSTGQKLYFFDELAQPLFSILDPSTTCSLPARQTANGIIDTFVHTTERYFTYPTGAALTDRQAEAILLTLIEQGPKALANPNDYEARANLMWCATCGHNGSLDCGLPGDGATHMIGHELTALYGIDHAQTLAIVLPGVMAQQFDRKKAKLAQYSRRVWNLQGSDEVLAREAIVKTEAFFRSLGVNTTLTEYKIPASDIPKIAARVSALYPKLGEHGDVNEADIQAILNFRIGAA